MPKQKNNIRFLFIIAFALSPALYSSCNKTKGKQPINYHFTATIPLNGYPVQGVNFRIVEFKHSSFLGFSSETEATGRTFYGQTDEHGTAIGQFDAYKEGDYAYVVTFYYHSMVLPQGITDYSVIAQSGSHLSRNSGAQNAYSIKIIPKCYIHFKLDNQTCTSAADSVRFMSFNSDRYPDQNFQWMYWDNSFFVGCGIVLDQQPTMMVDAGHWEYKLQMHRNGNVSESVYSFNLVPGIVNDVTIIY